MWVNPKYVNRQDALAVVEQRGTLLAAIPRGRPDPDGDFMEEFRVALDEFQGHPFVSLRLFQRGQDGQYYPVKGKGCSVRLAEGERVAAAILEAVRLADLPGGGRAESSSPVPMPATPALPGSKADHATAPWESY